MAEATEPSFKVFKSNEDWLLFQKRRLSGPYVQQSGRFITLSLDTLNVSQNGIVVIATHKYAHVFPQLKRA